MEFISDFLMQLVKFSIECEEEHVKLGAIHSRPVNRKLARPPPPSQLVMICYAVLVNLADVGALIQEVCGERVVVCQLACLLIPADWTAARTVSADRWREIGEAYSQKMVAIDVLKDVD